MKRKPKLSLQVTKHCAVLGDFIEIRRGISTGCNEFFVLADGVVRARKIPMEFLKPVIPTRIPIRDCNFSEADWKSLRIAEHRCWLLALPAVDKRQFEASVRAYLSEGIRRGLHATATAQRLRVWYSLPIPESPPDIFVSYLFRGAPRVIANSAGVFHLTNILGGRFKRGVCRKDTLPAVVAALNVVAKSWIENYQAGREYRDGLRKIEPREFQAMPISREVLSLLNTPEEGNKNQSPKLFD